MNYDFKIDGSFSPLGELRVIASLARVERHDFPAAFRPAFARESEQAGGTALNQLLADVANDVAGRANRGVLGRSSRGGKRRRIIHGTVGHKRTAMQNLLSAVAPCRS